MLCSTGLQPLFGDVQLSNSTLTLWVLSTCDYDTAVSEHLMLFCFFFQRDCESDQEEEVQKRKPRTRKRSSTSWNNHSIKCTGWFSHWIQSLCTFVTHTLQLLLVSEDQLEYLFDWQYMQYFLRSGQLCLFVCFSHRTSTICCMLNRIFPFLNVFSGMKIIIVDRNWKVNVRTCTRVETASSNSCSLKNPSNVVQNVMILLLNYFLVTVLAACEDSHKVYCAKCWEINGFNTAG